MSIDSNNKGKKIEFVKRNGDKCSGTILNVTTMGNRGNPKDAYIVKTDTGEYIVYDSEIIQIID